MSLEARPRAFLLKPGHLERDAEGNILDARSSVTLILAPSKKIIVDTGLEDEADLIKKRLAELGLSPEEVDLVINTHDHADHCGNNRLFTRAQVLLGKGGRRLKEGEVVAPGVWIMETPGHTLDSISVVCESSRKIVVAGDALPLMGNYLKWVPPRLHVDRDLAMESMARIVEIADLVVPGHDSPFLVRERTRTADLH
ncbi:MAG TPA: MBL fold metallo-hydrolase [Methanothrix sp.]|nr:MBL fold metallo-hydrolase [Methanothrix sp.]HPJ83662.1 MBL fold metallo-hydrolase [Methanothrix sp.]HPR66346.1 MBL fold metallo-hydrolase [Methanothrix sp.]HPR66623.1 MBL fold metallo-hydrolase [Methanothrix sp.]